MGSQINITHPNKPIVNYWMISALLLAFLLLGSWGLNIFSTYKAGPSDTQKQKTGVILQLDKTTYRSGEPIGFTITNNTQQNIYYFPESCAGSLVQVFKATDENSPPIGDPVVCLLQPSVQTLSMQQGITGNIRDKTLLMMTPGRYKIKFYYSLEKRDRFAIGAQSVIESETLTIVK